MKKTDMRALHYGWKVRVGSPRELVWELYQFLASKGFFFDEPYEPLELEPTPIEGAASFRGSIEGHRDFPGRSMWRLILGIILCLTILLIPVGTWLVRKSKHVFSDLFEIQVEGEAYRASARTHEPHHPQSEVLDIASNARITLDARLRFIRGGKLKRVKNESQLKRLEGVFAELRNELDRLIPKIALPVATDESKLE